MQTANKLIIALSAFLNFIDPSLVYGDSFPIIVSYQSDLNNYLIKFYRDCFKEAEELYAATLFEAAALKYEEILRAIEQGNMHTVNDNAADLYSLVYCRLGQIYYFQNDYERANSFFASPRASISLLSPHLKKLEMQAAYLHAVSSRRLRNHELAFSALTKHAAIADSIGVPIFFEAQYEKGLNHFLMGNLVPAKEEFQSLSLKIPQLGPASNSELYTLSQLYLGRISILSGEYDHSEELLAELSARSPLVPDGNTNSLCYEIAYLRGEIAFHKGDFLRATEFLEESLPKRKHQISNDWSADALVLSGWSYLKLGEDTNTSMDIRRGMFAKAEKYFKQAIDERGKESDLLALSQCYLTKSYSLQDPESLKLAEQTLSRRDEFSSLEAKVQDLLLRAEITRGYADKEKLYAQVTDLAPQFADGWYKRGVNEYLRGATTQSPEESNAAFKRSAAALGMAYPLLQAIDQHEAEIVLKLFMRALLQEGSRESNLAVIAVAEELTKVENGNFSKMRDQKEIYYLYGQAACRLADEEGNDKFIEVAEKALWYSVTDAKGEAFADDSLNLLGTFYLRRGANVKSEETFLHLIAHYPQSPYAGDALYYCAENAEKLGKDPELIRKYRHQLFAKYPQSQHAPSAYFHYYPYREYLQGDKEALKHLKNFLETFPDSPLTITAHFLIGLDYKRDRKTIEGRSIRKKNLLKAIESFADVERLFESKKHLIAENEMPYYVNIRYRALLERAVANQVISHESQGTKREIYFQYAEEMYKQIFREFADSKHPLASCLTKIEPFPKAYEESLHSLIKGYRNANNTVEAKKLIDEALGKYQEIGITSGYYLSRIHFERGKIEMHNKEFELAWEAFTRAEESNKDKFLSSDQKLDLWIQQALCCKSLGQMDKAMLILSKVINDDAVSGQRLKAMYLRAEVYELQGRTELARKQLEATAKKAGDWAHKAKVKLDKEYGY
ncbi:MAG: hypothetical protein H0U49_05055 [Parachlamydiaceae bacterium]|nr:hypothetical protein [Parachlamydiaceae bacterium]